MMAQLMLVAVVFAKIRHLAIWQLLYYYWFRDQLDDPLRMKFEHELNIPTTVNFSTDS